MSEQDKTQTPETEAKAEEAVRVAKPGVIDEGHTVTGAGGERMSGLIADIADGDT